MERAGKLSEQTAAKLKELSDPLEKVKKAWDVILDPIVAVEAAQEKLKAGLDNVKSAFNTVAHPIEAFKGKIEESRNAIKAQREALVSAQATYNIAADEVKGLKAALQESIASTGAASDETKELSEKLATAEQSAERAKKELDTLSQSEKETGDEAENAEPKLAKLGTALGTGLKAAAGVAVTALAAAGAAVVSLGTSAISSYGEYEQLAGGIDKLFGDASGTLKAYAQDAYATAGMSANEYMSNVTGFSAALINSLGGDTERAAEVANMAMQDIADNANTFGKYSAEELAGVYQALAKGQYQTLDNLNLGYGGTKEGMQQLIDKAIELQAANGVVAEYSIDNFADIAEAIHVVQENLNITGTTANEAGSTIEGSTTSMKAAWQNLLTAFADPEQDLGGAIDKLVESAMSFADNIIPRIVELAPRLSEGVVQLANTAAEMLPGVINDILPPLTDAAVSLIEAFSTSVVPLLPGLIASLLPALISTAEALGTSLADAIPPILTAAMSAIPQLLSAALEIVMNLVDALLDPKSLQEILDAGLEMMASLSDGILEFLPELVERLPEIITGIVEFFTENLPTIIETGTTILTELTFGIIDALPQLIEQLPEIISAIIEVITENLPLIAEQGATILGELIVGILGAIPELAEGMLEVTGEILTSLDDILASVFDTGINIITGLWDGISSKVAWLGQKIGGVVSDIKGWFTGPKAFDVHSPSKWAHAVGEYVSIGLANGIEEKATEAEEAAEAMAKNIYNGLSTWADKQVKYNELTLQDQLEMWQAIQDQFIEDSQYYEKAEEKIFDLKKQIQEDYYDKVEEITQNITDLEDNYQQTLADRTQEIYNIYGLFDEIPERQRVSGTELMRNLENQISLIEEFYNGLEELTERGVSESLVDEIREMGPSAVDQLNALLKMSDEKLEEYAKLYEEKQQLANEIATKELEELRNDTTSQIAQNLEELQQLYNSEAPEVGQAFATGLAAGIRNGMSTVISSAVTMAQAAVDAVRDKLGIHSPSRVFAGIGENMALGLSRGWEREFISSKADIVSNLDFGEVPFRESAAARSSSGIINSMLADPMSGGEYTINVQIDGETAAQVLFDPLRGVVKQRGVALA